MKSLATIGKAIAHDSGVLHVTGTATYIDDIREPEGLLHVTPGYAREGAKGKLITIDLDAVRSAPGVVAVLTAKDIPGINDCSPGLGDDPIFATTEIAFHGQVIFAVVAETREAARRAARLAKIEVAAEIPAVSTDDAITMGTEDILPPYAQGRCKSCCSFEA
jgi:xanthine dehydrogenase large subunit